MSFISELKRRNVFRFAVAYLVFGWFVLQVADVLFSLVSLPDWGIKMLAVLLLIGFIPALTFSWVYELTPEGLKRESEIDAAQSTTGQTGQRLNLVTIILVVLAAGLLLADRFLLSEPVETSGQVTSSSSTATTGTEEADDSVPVIAVLPFKATGSDDGGFLASGLHDDLLTRLTRLRAFRVISRTSMMEYAETSKNMKQIGEELGAGFILEGGVQALGNRVRINAQLINAGADEHIWADTYDRELSAQDLFDVQAEIATSIAGQLEITLSQSDRALVDAVPTKNTEAYKAYLRGLELRATGLFTQHVEKSIIEAFEESVKLDPGFAQAWAQLSIARSRLSQITDDANLRDSALTALAEARTLKPDLLETGLAWVVYLYRCLLEYDQALEALEALGERVSLDAESLALNAYLARRVGHFTHAHKLMLKARQLEPRSINIADKLISMALTSGNCEAADQHVTDALDLAPDSSAVIRSLAEYELECNGDAKRANELMLDVAIEDYYTGVIASDAAFCARDYERLLELGQSTPSFRPLDPVQRQLNSAFALSLLGREEESQAARDKAKILLGEQDPDWSGESDFAYAHAALSAQLGDADATRQWLELTHERRLLETKNDSYIESMNKFYFADLLAMAGLHEEALQWLKSMLENPGGRNFQYIEIWPGFDVLRNDPVYIELHERFGRESLPN